MSNGLPEKSSVLSSVSDLPQADNNVPKIQKTRIRIKNFFIPLPPAFAFCVFLLILQRPAGRTCLLISKTYTPVICWYFPQDVVAINS
jgi:hypothetical protein